MREYGATACISRAKGGRRWAVSVRVYVGWALHHQPCVVGLAEMEAESEALEDSSDKMELCGNFQNFGDGT